MKNFLKKDKGPSRIIEFIPSSKFVELAGMPPLPSIKILPDWYKKIPSLSVGDSELIIRGGLTNATIKRCIPFLDAMTAGYTVVLANDVQVWWKDGSPQFEWISPTRNMISTHDLYQIPGLPIPEGYHAQPIKWHNDYIIKTPKDYSLFCMHPSNRFDLPFLTISGFVDTDNYETSIQFPFFIKEGWNGIIESGTPLAQIIPIKRELWKSEIKLFDEERVYAGLENLKRKVVRSYKKQFWSRKSYE